MTRRNFGAWLGEVTPSWHWDWPYLAYIREHLDKVTTGECKRLAIFIPPRHGKSEMVTVRYPVWRLERDPSLRVIIAAYGQLLAEKFSRKARRIAEGRPIALAQDRFAVHDWETAAGGGVRAVGVGSGITGQGGNLIVIDDPVKSRDEAESETYRERCWDWYRDDLYTRLEPHGAIILIQTRWHEDDLAGRILASEDAPNWTVITLPALAEEGDALGRAVGEALCPARYDAEALRRIQQMNARSFYALYQQRPQPDQGTIFQRDWFPRQNAIDRSTARLVVQAWDTAYGEGQESDYTVCVTVGVHPNGLFVLGVWRGRVDYPNLLRAMNAQAQMWRPEVVLVEDRGSGQSAVQTLRAQTALPIIGVPAVKSKVERAQTVTGLCEAGRVVIPPTEWGDVLLDELLRFPTAKHDDQVDAFVYAVQRAGNLTAGAVSVMPY